MQLENLLHSHKMKYPGPLKLDEWSKLHIVSTYENNSAV